MTTVDAMPWRSIRTMIVDDEPLARRRLRTLLALHPDVELVAECDDGPEAVEVINRERPDVVFLDVQMTTLDGLDVVRALGVSPPPAIVFVTAFDQYAVDAFDVHALDYLLKPFDEERFSATLKRVREHVATARTRDAHERLLAFMHELEESSRPPSPHRSRHVVLRIADIEVDVTAREVRRAGTLVPLRRKEFDLLLALVRRPGELVSRRELLQEVWGYKDDVVSRTIDTHLVELRRKLGHSPGEPGYVHTVARTGYRIEP